MIIAVALPENELPQKRVKRQLIGRIINATNDVGGIIETGLTDGADIAHNAFDGSFQLVGQGLNAVQKIFAAPPAPATTESSNLDKTIASS